MSTLKHIYLKNKGFTLIELVLVLSIASILMLPLYSILSLSLNSCSRGEVIDELNLSGRYAIEYIKREVKGAYRVVNADKMKGLDCENNIGFVLVFEEKDQYNYVTYYIDKKSLYRYACRGDKDKYLYLSESPGRNKICDLFVSFKDSKLSPDGIISLNFLLESNKDSKWEESLYLTTDIYIRCGIEY